jgi:AraC family transcriptional regulator of arabinose operon
MRINIGSSYPLFPRTGYVRYQGERVAWREADLENWNLYFTFLGVGEILFRDGQMRTAHGELLLLPPKLDRSYRVADPAVGWGFYFLHFRPTKTLRRTLRWFDRMQPQEYMVADPTMQNRITATLEEMFQINLRTPEIGQRALLLDALLETVLLRVASVQGGVKTAGGGIDLRIEKAIELFHNDFSARHTINGLARAANLSRSQFCLLFRAGIGRSPQEYMEERRLELARFYLMTTAHSVSEIAANVGFEDPFYFSTRFKRRFELSPSAFRHARALERGVHLWTPALKGEAEIAKTKVSEE